MIGLTTTKVSNEELSLLKRIAFLTSDIEMAKKNEGFAVAMNVNIEENEKRRAELVDLWELMP